MSPVPAAGDAGLHPLAHIDETVHQRVRLGILAILADTDDADFSYLRRSLGLTDGNLGRHLEVLLRHGYVSVSTSGAGRRRRTWVGITRSGRDALDLEVQLLRNLLAGHASARETQERRRAAEERRHAADDGADRDDPDLADPS